MRAARLVPAYKNGISGYLAIKKSKSYSLAHFFLLKRGFLQQKAVSSKGWMEL